MKPIIFSDIDGTLLNSQGKISPGTLAAIRTLEEKGIPFVISSGRGPTGIYPILDEKDPIPESYHFEVCSAGLERTLKRPGVGLPLC